jgi:hypothetical protein
MKSMIKQGPGKHYYIRNNKVNCIDKTLSAESGWMLCIYDKNI